MQVQAKAAERRSGDPRRRRRNDGGSGKAADADAAGPGGGAAGRVGFAKLPPRFHPEPAGDDGATLVRIDVADLPPEEPGFELQDGMLPLSARPASAFQGVPGMHRYTRVLAGTDLSKVIYPCGTMDRAVGRLTEDEVAFLDSRGAEVIAVAGGHGSMFEDAATTRRIVDLLDE